MAVFCFPLRTVRLSHEGTEHSKSRPTSNPAEQVQIGLHCLSLAMHKHRVKTNSFLLQQKRATARCCSRRGLGSVTPQGRWKREGRASSSCKVSHHNKRTIAEVRRSLSAQGCLGHAPLGDL